MSFKYMKRSIFISDVFLMYSDVFLMYSDVFLMYSNVFLMYSDVFQMQFRSLGLVFNVYFHLLSSIASCVSVTYIKSDVQYFGDFCTDILHN